MENLIVHFSMKAYFGFVWQVNGVDVCGSTHDEVITIFKNAQEPLVVELLRQLPTPWPHFFDVATQTELSLHDGEMSYVPKMLWRYFS